MEIVNDNAAMLSDYEVLSLLREHNVKYRSSNHRIKAVTSAVLRYLDNSPCTEQSPDKIKILLSVFQPFNLTKQEKLMLINNPPKKEIDVHLIVADSAERLTEDQIQEILKISGCESNDKGLEVEDLSDNE